MEPKSTIFLKLVITAIATLVLSLSLFILYNLVIKWGTPRAEYAYLLYPVVFFMYLSAIPFFAALFQGWKLLTYIDNNTAVSSLSILALKNIKYCAATIAFIYSLLLPFWFMLAQLDDAPGIVLLGIIVVGASVVIAIFAAVLQKLFQSGIDLKSENELTV